DVFICGNWCVSEGVVLQAPAFLAPAVILSSGTTFYDLVHNQVYKRTSEKPLTIPRGAVLVPGSRAASGEFAGQHKLSLYAPIIVKYRDEKTDASTMLEEAIR